MLKLEDDKFIEILAELEKATSADRVAFFFWKKWR